jgi:REP element-mobilizing transposase RayT
MPVPRQTLLFQTGEFANPRNEHGGAVGVGRRKTARPIHTRKPMHVVLRSTRAKGSWSLRRRANDASIRSAMRGLAQRFDIRIYEFGNAGNHLHLLLRARKRPLFQAFLRAFAGTVARCVTGARKGRPVGKFWDLLAFSRVLHWGREFALVRRYVITNELEGQGLIPHRRAKRRREGGAAQRGMHPLE